MTVVHAASSDDIATIVRAASGGSLVVVIEPGRDPLSAALAEASIAPLAVERAPGMRINAVVGDGAAADVAAMAGFLDTAGSTTGQVVRIT
ncbi:Rossmann fold domain-containing protein [uncultured Sphingomonas sp.]|uniref:Rossmann fold domain-containing protein n=1 Tax=uncultured Sphingomonas sp. TaxID=158754 RepID=UPI0035C99C8F